MKGRIVEIKRFAVHDGPGIRTTVFLKGCPLKCRWCHNPESISFHAQLAWYERQCISCGACVQVCPADAQKMRDKKHIFERRLCIGCGNCESVCTANALQFYGREKDVDELLPILLEDREFYENSGGGVTLSGGECLVQTDFCRELLEKVKAQGIHTAVDTCGDVPQQALMQVMAYTDLFLYDIKAVDEDVHIRCTGKNNRQILKNLRYLDQHGKKLEIRIPFSPEWNGNQIEKIGEMLKSFRNITRVRVLPCHNYAGEKYAALDMLDTLPERMPEEKEVLLAQECLKAQGLPVV